jgi:hypothetical protein
MKDSVVVYLYKKIRREQVWF